MGLVLICLAVPAAWLVGLRLIEGGEFLTGKGFELLWRGIEVLTLRPRRPPTAKEPEIESESESAEKEPQEKPAPKQDEGYRWALRYLGLQDGCSKAVATRVYWAAREACKFGGGDDERAAEVERAMDVICARRGWRK